MRQSPSREHRIVTDLRQKILDGRLAPGTRLSTRAEIETQFDVATQTVQRAMSRLIRDGFLVARGKLGTFVVNHPPHLHHYGLVLAGDPTLPGAAVSTKFSNFLYRETINCRKSGERNISTYLSVNGHADSEDYHRLLEHVRAHRLAGLFFDMPTHLNQPPLSELLDVPGLPCVSIADTRQHPNLTLINLPQHHAVDRALDYLRTRGRHSVALLATAMDESLFHHFEQGVVDRGMTTRTFWLQAVSPHTARSARNCAHLLMQARERPDALLISDDSLVEHATAGLVDAGVRVPQELEVVAHCNFPYPTPSQVRAKRIGFDIREVLRLAIDLIDRRRRGEQVGPVTTVAPLFDDEVPAPTPTRVPEMVSP